LAKVAVATPLKEHRTLNSGMAQGILPCAKGWGADQILEHRSPSNSLPSGKETCLSTSGNPT